MDTVPLLRMSALADECSLSVILLVHERLQKVFPKPSQGRIENPKRPRSQSRVLFILPLLPVRRRECVVISFLLVEWRRK